MNQRILRRTCNVLFTLFLLQSLAPYDASSMETRNVYGSSATESAKSAEAALSDGDCYVEVASIDYGEWSEKLDNNRFRHVFQYIDEYPYFRRVGNAYVGIETERYFPDSIRPNRSYWTNVDGRRGVGARGHYSLIQDFRGEANVRGVAVSVNVADEFAFFLYDRDSDTSFGYYANVAKDGLLGVMTTIEDEAGFVDVGKASNWRLGLNTRLRAWSSRFLDSEGEWKEGIYDKKQFRTLFFLNSQVTVAGVERKVTKICRLAGSPAVVTNSDRLVPAIEEELMRRADRIHALRIVNNEIPSSREEWRSSFSSLSTETFIKVLSVPKDHSGDIGVSTEIGEIAITFTRDPYSDRIYYRPEKVWRSDGAQHDTGLYHFYVEGHLTVDGKDLGWIVNGGIGTYRLCCSEDTSRLKNQQFNMQWKNVDRDGYRMSCGSEECKVYIKQELLRLH